MKKITKRELTKEIKREYKLGVDFTKRVRGGYFKLMIDTEDGTIWSDRFIDVGSFKKYRSAAIQALSYCGRNDQECIDNFLEDAVSQLKNAGWEITE